MKQITFGDDNILLTNISVWSHDGQWIVFDTRIDRDGANFDCDWIGRVHVDSGTVQKLYLAKHGAKVGVVTASPTDERLVFIHGPEHPTSDWSYNAFHRHGCVIAQQASSTDDAIWQSSRLDARDIVSPFTPGALRGGSHVHVFSGDGQWVSFTYEDHVLATTDEANCQRNQRNVGVSVPVQSVVVPKTHPRNQDGSHFSVLVSQTSDNPRPGSDEISRAYSDAWVGQDGYRRADGGLQKRSIAFIGDCVDESGQTVPELFVVDLPNAVTHAGGGPLCGTSTTRPVPPAGTCQRRITRTTDRTFPGVHGVRLWPRSSPDGEVIAFLMRDDHGVSQLWRVSPRGTDLRQLTTGDLPIASAFSFRCDGAMIACVIGERVCEVDVQTGEVVALTLSDDSGSPPLELACVYSPDGKSIAYLRRLRSAIGEANQVFVCSTSCR
ncbi:DUF3748 domain-containing protein [Neorhodopirellula lusitana]|uniref:DUF3748 domain-containing protein n=1 Tax=Neorhodopirellula lusitana TaxID=445327 RepID=UPI00384F30C1